MSESPEYCPVKVVDEYRNSYGSFHLLKLFPEVQLIFDSVAASLSSRRIQRPPLILSAARQASNAYDHRNNKH